MEHRFINSKNDDCVYKVKSKYDDRWKWNICEWLLLSLWFCYVWMDGCIGIYKINIKQFRPRKLLTLTYSDIPSS